MTLTENNLAEISNAKQDIMKLWIDGVYVSAAYQDPEYLKMIFRRNVDNSLPGVRFDIEESDNSLLVYTTLAKEITGFTNPIKQDINKKKFRLCLLIRERDLQRLADNKYYGL